MIHVQYPCQTIHWNTDLLKLLMPFDVSESFKRYIFDIPSAVINDEGFIRVLEGSVVFSKWIIWFCAAGIRDGTRIGV